MAIYDYRWVNEYHRMLAWFNQRRLWGPEVGGHIFHSNNLEFGALTSAMNDKNHIKHVEFKDASDIHITEEGIEVVNDMNKASRKHAKQVL